MNESMPRTEAFAIGRRAALAEADAAGALPLSLERLDWISRCLDEQGPHECDRCNRGDGFARELLTEVWRLRGERFRQDLKRGPVGMPEADIVSLRDLGLDDDGGFFCKCGWRTTRGERLVLHEALQRHVKESHPASTALLAELERYDRSVGPCHQCSWRAPGTTIDERITALLVHLRDVHGHPFVPATFGSERRAP